MDDYGVQIFDRWARLWSGDLALAEELMAATFTLRYAQPGATVWDDVKDPATFAEQIAAFRGDRDLRYRAEGDPVVALDDTRTGLVARPYGAHFTEVDATPKSVSGNDILRLDNGRIVEVWSASGGLNGRSFY